MPDTRVIHSHACITRDIHIRRAIGEGGLLEESVSHVAGHEDSSKFSEHTRVIKPLSRRYVVYSDAYQPIPTQGSISIASTGKSERR